MQLRYVLSRIGSITLQAVLFTGVAGPAGASADTASRALHQVTLTGGPVAVPAMAAADSATQANRPSQSSLKMSYATRLLSFEMNRGQTDPRVDFLARGSGYTLFLSGGDATLALRSGDGTAAGATVRIGFTGTRKAVQGTGVDLLPGKVSYLRGKDRSAWRSNIPTYGRVRYAELYRGIDLVFYGKQRELEHDFVVAAGADPSVIAFTLDGASGVSLDGQGNLLIRTATGDVSFRKPRIYQQVEAKTRIIDGGYTVPSKNEAGVYRVGFRVGPYDKTLPLVIDPVIDYSTYLGGTGDDFANGIAVDADFNAYVTGRTHSADFPGPKDNFYVAKTLPGVPVPPPAGGSDAFVTKLEPYGRYVIYSVYLGGSGDEGGIGIALDSGNRAYITGWTMSANFPVTGNALQGSYGGNIAGGFGDAFIARLNAAGTALDYATYLGGKSEDYGRGIAVDVAGNIYLTGSTRSKEFPVINSPYTKEGDDPDVFVTKLGPSGQPTRYDYVYSIPIGGTGLDEGRGLAVDNTGNVFVTGQTHSKQGFGGTFGGDRGDCLDDYGNKEVCPDAFILKLDSSGSLLYSRYLGRSGREWATGIAVDKDGNAYIGGVTDSTDFPCLYNIGGNGGEDGFIVKITGAGNNQEYITRLGGPGNERVTGVAVDGKGRAHVAGVTSSSGLETPGERGYGGGASDAFVAKLTAAGNAFEYFTYLGGSGADDAESIAVPIAGIAYVTGATLSTDFPTTQAPYKPPFQQFNHGPGTGTWGDAYVARLMEDRDGDGIPDPWETEGVGRQRRWDSRP